MVEIMRNYYNECKRCNENISEEKVNKKMIARNGFDKEECRYGSFRIGGAL